jgi:transposase
MFVELVMAMGTRKDRERQEDLWVAYADMAVGPGHPFYVRLNEVLDGEGFDAFVEKLCARFYAEKLGRPGLTPGIYFRSLMIGYFEGIEAERGIAWRLKDSLSLRRFLGIALDEDTPDHSTISRTRRLIDVETHRQVFSWVLGLLADRALLQGKRIGIDATTLEASAAMRSIVRRDTGESYEEFLTGLAKASGIETPTREDLARLGPQAQEAHLEQGVEESYRPGCAGCEDEGRQHASGSQGRTCGRSGFGRGSGRHLAGG